MRVARWTARVIGAALLGTTAGIHAYLYHCEGYHSIPTISWMFLLLIISATIVGLAVLAAPTTLLPWVAALGAALEAATVISLVVLTHHEFFNYMESTMAPLYWPSVFVEIAGAAVLGGLAGTAVVTRSRGHGRVSAGRA
jgi:hypothetical protein